MWHLMAHILAGCSTQAAGAPKAVSQAAQGAQPVYGGTLTLDLSSQFPHLDPAKAYDAISYEALYQFYDQLVTYKGAANTLVPDLASWSISGWRCRFSRRLIRRT